MALRTVKCVMVGDNETGMSHAAAKYVTGQWLGTYVSATEFEFWCKNTVIDGQNVQLHMRPDVTEAENHDMSQFNIETNVIMIAYNLANRSTLINAVEKWAPEVKKHLPKIPIVLAGMQLDRLEPFEKKQKKSARSPSRKRQSRVIVPDVENQNLC